MHHDRPGMRQPQQRRVDAVPFEGGEPLPGLGFLSHAGPDVRVKNVGSPRRFRGVADDPDLSAAESFAILPNRGIRFVPLRARDPQVETEDVGRLDP